MKTMIVLSLLLNILVLVPVCSGLLWNAGWVQGSYGPATTARGILLAVYLGILAVSAFLLATRDPRPVAALLAVQIVYKLLTPLTAGTLLNPVVVSNLGIAAFHAVTLGVIWLQIGNPFRSP